MAAEPIDAIAAAIAARYTNANMPAPGGLPGVRLATSALPTALTRGLPAVLVFPDQGSMSSGNGTRRATLVYLVRFYLCVRKDLGRETAQVLTWLPVLVGQHQGGITLGLSASGVTAARTVGWRAGVLRYAAQAYTGAELRVEVETSIAWTVTP